MSNIRLNWVAILVAAIAAVIWFGFIATSWAKACIFEVRTFEIFAIYTGYYLIDPILMGAIVGGWKIKTEARPQPQ